MNYRVAFSSALLITQEYSRLWDQMPRILAAAFSPKRIVDLQKSGLERGSGSVLLHLSCRRMHNVTKEVSTSVSSILRRQQVPISIDAASI